MAGSSGADIVVVGAGVIGASIAYHLAGLGAAVLVADPGTPRFPSASWASAGGVRRQNRDPREWALTIAASERWPRLEDELAADCEFRAGGHLHVAENDEDLAHLAARAAEERAGGVPVEVVDARAARELAPILGPTVVGGTFTCGDGHANPRRTTEAFLDAAIRRGAVHRTESITGFLRAPEPGGGRPRVVGVEFGSDRIPASQVVVAAGSWTPRLVAALGVDLPIRVEGLQMLLSDATEPVLAPTIGAERRAISFKQLPGGAFFIGGGWPADVDAAAHTCSVRDDAVRGSWQTARELVPALRVRTLADRWCGLEGRSIDSVPCIGPLPGVAGAYVAAGFSGHGFQLSPAVGAEVANALSGRPAPALAGLGADRMTALAPAEIEAFRRGAVQAPAAG